MSASMIGWIVTLAFIVLLVAGFFIGMWRGLKKSTTNLIFSLVGAVIAFFVTPMIAKKILGITISYNNSSVPLSDLALQMAKEDAQMAQLIDSTPNFEKLLANLPHAIVSAVAFIFVTIAIESFIYIIYRIIASIFLKNRDGQKMHRVWGGAVGLVKTFVITLFAMMPFASLIGLASNMTSAESATSSASAAQEKTVSTDGLIKLPETADKIITGLENNMLIKCCGIFGMDDAMFDYYSSIKIDGENVVIRKEAQNIYEAVEAGYEISNMLNNDGNFSDIDFNSVAKNIDKVVDSGMFKTVVSEILGEMIANYNEYDFINDSSIVQENADIVSDISLGLRNAKANGKSYYQYFSNDIKKLVDIFKNVGESGMIDGAKDYEKVNDVVAYLTNDTNYATLEDCVVKLFEMNLVRDSANHVVQMALENVMPELDDIDVSTTGWTDKDWNDVGLSFAGVINNYGDVVAKVEVQDVLADATILLDEDKNYDIASITSNLGIMIDEIRANKLLKNSENKPIIDSYLAKDEVNLALPTSTVYDNEGNEVTISNYQKLFNFISPSLIQMRDEGVYKTLNDDKLTNTAKIKDLAEIISKDGNENILSEIILPLYQVEPTHTIIINEITSSVGDGLIKFSSLESYEEWKRDLKYVSPLLKTLNTSTAFINGENKKYLDLILDDEMDVLVDVMIPTEVDAIFTPVLHAKSTAAIKNNIVDNIKTSIEELADTTISMTAENVTFTDDESNVNDQTEEFLAVVKGLVAINKLDNVNSIKDVDKTLLGTTLDAMKVNAYRKDNYGVEEGIYADAFVKVVDSLKTSYSDEITALSLSTDEADVELYNNLTSGNYNAINFTALLVKLSSISA